MRFNIIFLVFGLSLFSIAAFSQTYIPAQLVTNNNDTITGYIKKTNLNKFSERITFKEQPDNENVYFIKPDSIKAFSANDYYFISSNLENYTGKLFFKVIVNGYAQLLSNRLNGSEVFYLKKQNQPAKQYDRLHPWNFLTAFFYDCSDIRLDSDKALYSQKDLINLVMEYNWCVKPEEQSEIISKAEKKFKLHKGLKAGYSINNFSANQSIARSYNSDNTLYGGIFLLLDFGGRLAFQPELLYINKYARSERLVSGGVVLEIIDYELEMIQLPLLASYTFLKEKTISPYLIAGPYAYLPLQLDGTQQQYSGDTEILNTDRINLDSRFIGLMAGAGLNYDLGRIRFYGEFRYDNTFLSEGVNLTQLNFNSYQFSLGVSF